MEILSRFPDVHVGVIGDFFLDYYLVLDKTLSEISLETGLEAYQVTATRKSPGAAGTVTSILRSMDVRVSAAGFTGDDGNGYDLRSGLTNSGVNIDQLFLFTGRFTPTYMKPMLLEHGLERELSRMDIKNRRVLPPDMELALIEGIRKVVHDVDAVVLIDQVEERNCGVITEKVLKEIGRLADEYPHKIFIGDSRFYAGDLSNVMIKTNRREAAQALGYTLTPEISVDGLGEALYGRKGKAVMITDGSKGISVSSAAGTFQVPAVKVEGPIDIVGAGDSVMASMSAALCAGASLAEAACIAMLTASIIVQQIGVTGKATRDEILARYHDSLVM